MEDGGTEYAAAPDDAAAALADMDLLRAAAPDDVRAVAERVDWLRLAAGEELFAQGDAADGMYFVVRGRLECLADGRLLREVPRGGIIGELALLVDGRRSASVRAVRDCLLARLQADDLPALIATGPGIALELARVVASRAVSGPSGTERPTARSVAVVSLDPSEDAVGLADAVADRLRSDQVVSRVDGASVAEWFSTGGNEMVADRLADQEDRSETMVVTVGAARGADGEADLIATVLRQMDLVVAVARPGARVDAETVAHLAAASRPISVAVLHRTGTRPSGTAAHLARLGAALEVRDHVHLRDGNPSDLDRFARILSGRSVGLVLGGGGSRGFAHIGVVRALREAGIPIDRIGGSSMGAVMSAQVALGWTFDEMVERNRSTWSKRGLAEVGVPTLSLLRGQRAVNVFDTLFGDRRIEDLWIDYFCTTVDLSAFRLHIAKSGPVAEWARSSASVPGLWPPLVDAEGHLHIDGGVLNNVPTDIMRGSNVGSVVGVDVSKRQSPMTVQGAPSLPTGVALLVERRRRWVPTIVDVLNRSNLLASLQTKAHSDRHADLFLAPPVKDEGFAAFDKISELAELGYRFACDELERADLSSLPLVSS